jgi:hypothetical protein
MSAIIASPDVSWEVLEKVVVGGDLAKLSSQERVLYYRQLCESLGLNPLTRPFQYILLSGKLTLYATKDATDQIRRRHRISIDRVEKQIVNDAYVVTVYGHTEDGRTDTEMGVVSIAGKQGDELANAMLKTLTKAKRRLTLSMCGLGILDETETETIRGAVPAEVDQDGHVIAGRPDTQPTPIRAAIDEEPLITSHQRRHLWALAKAFYGREDAEAKLHQDISFQYPTAVRDGRPSMRALSEADAAVMIAVYENAIRQQEERADEMPPDDGDDGSEVRD